LIRTRGLTKSFGPILAVDAVDLDVRAGDRYGFLGPNGSGKTTVIRMLLGLVYATTGEIEVLGKRMPARAAEVLPDVGSLVEGPSAYPHLSGRANLTLIDAAGSGGRRDRKERIGAALDQVGLGGIDGRPVGKYSLGMRQRLGLAAALLRRPRLLILDEPANGLDPRGIRELRDLLAGLSAAGTTIFLSSHQLSEVEQLCGRVGVIDRGRLVLQEDLDTLRAPTGRVLVRSPEPDRVAAELDGSVRSRDGETLVVTGIGVSEIAPERRSLEDVVLSLTTASADRIDRADWSEWADRDDRGDRGGGMPVPRQVAPGRADGADVLVTGDPEREENGSR
jgi:ABC-type multidrug transport system ATPase subunit